MPHTKDNAGASLNRQRLLLLSNSMTAAGFLTHAINAIRDFLGSATREVIFIPYASVLEPLNDYADKTAAAFTATGCQMKSLHTLPDPVAALRRASAIVVGGGNTFHLLRRLYDESLLNVIRECAIAGVPYVGWSAGANVACPTIKTTNDMPIVWVQSLDALGLVPFQINPHYVEAVSPEFFGETRARRLLEFTHLHPDVHVVALPEGAMIRIEGDAIQLLGCSAVKLFVGDDDPVEVQSLDFLQQPTRATRAFP